MKSCKVVSAILAAIVVCTVSAKAQEKGSWRAASSSAKSVTGDIAFATEKLTINFAVFPVVQIRAMQPAELKAAFDLDGNPAGTGNLFKLNVPASIKFMHKNSLCGDETAQWMVTYVAGRSLQVAIFSGQTVPLFTSEAIATTTNLCGTFMYVR
jgi:hypothetical protein